MHAANMPVRVFALAMFVAMALVRGGERLFVQRLQHAAFGHGRGRRAALPDRFDLAFEIGQLGDARFNVAQVLVQQVVDFFAGGLRIGLQFKQPADFSVRHVERPALRNEGQLLDMLGRVDAVVVGGARSRGQQALRFIEADGLDADARALGEFANFHTR